MERRALVHSSRSIPEEASRKLFSVSTTEGLFPIHIASMFGYAEIVSTICAVMGKDGANYMTSTGDYPLHFASTTSLACVTALVHAGAEYGIAISITTAHPLAARRH